MITRWEKRDHFDVWGNEHDGYTVNDSMVAGEIELDAEIEIHNAGTPQEFKSAYLTRRTLREVFGMAVDTPDGDDMHYEIETEDGYPIGSLTCVSHESLSPIKELSCRDHSQNQPG